MAQGYQGWSPESILALTETQVAMLMHSSWVANKRGEIKRQFERTCVGCGEESVSNGVCSSCNLMQMNKKFGSGIEYSEETLEWPPKSGIFYTSDDEFSAAEQLKKKDPRQYTQYMQYVMSQGMNQNANEIARKRGLLK